MEYASLQPKVFGKGSNGFSHPSPPNVFETVSTMYQKDGKIVLSDEQYNE